MIASQGGNSGTAFRRCGYQIEDGALDITLFSGVVYGGFRQERINAGIQDGLLNGAWQGLFAGWLRRETHIFSIGVKALPCGRAFSCLDIRTFLPNPHRIGGKEECLWSTISSSPAL